ncbi:MAG: transcription antitermination factor NusB [Akkermansiaceae bacterium]|jgi:N utilization substance protein B|nr:transcription antitermination factor NusB [Akkermansiaceae bacterium]
MPSRRQIREAAIQFLYSADLEGGSDPAALREPFWQFVTESDRRGLAVATWKTLHHLQLAREERHEAFEARFPAALATLKADPSLESSATLLRRIAVLESEWSAAMTATARIPRDGDDEAVVAQLEPAIEKLFLINRELLASRKGFGSLLDDRPDLRPRLEPLVGAMSRLDRISDRVRMLEHPEDFPDQPELRKVRECTLSLRELRSKVDALVDAVLARKAEVDQALFAVIENYAPERVDPIDRAILRLATWEILFDAEVPAPVAINEAIELARTFGTSDSPRFVNGVLDKVAKA